MSCRVTVELGHELVYNARPMIFLWSGGINPNPLREGSGFATPTTSTIDVNIDAIFEFEARWHGLSQHYRFLRDIMSKPVWLGFGLCI